MGGIAAGGEKSFGSSVVRGENTQFRFAESPPCCLLRKYILAVCWRRTSSPTTAICPPLFLTHRYSERQPLPSPQPLPKPQPSLAVPQPLNHTNPTRSIQLSYNVFTNSSHKLDLYFQITHALQGCAFPIYQFPRKKNWGSLGFWGVMCQYRNIRTGLTFSVIALSITKDRLLKYLDYPFYSNLQCFYIPFTLCLPASHRITSTYLTPLRNTLEFVGTFQPNDDVGTTPHPCTVDTTLSTLPGAFLDNRSLSPSLSLSIPVYITH